MLSPVAVLRRLFALAAVSLAAGLSGAAPAAAEEPEGPTKPAVHVEQPAADKPSDKSDKADEALAPRPVAKKRRGGIHPCMTPDPGFGIYDGWSGSGMSVGQVLMPHQGGLSKSGQFDVVVHFHGHEPIRKEF